MLTTLFLAAFLTSASLPLASDPGLAPARSAASQAAVAEPAAVQAAPADPASAHDPDFATWLAGEEEALPSPELELAAACKTCAQCPANTFCCILASGCAACTSRPTVCANGG